MSVYVSLCCLFQLLYYGRDYPLGFDYFRARLNKAFVKNKQLTDRSQIEQLLARGDYVIKELDALYKLKKYRHLRKSYYDSDHETDLIESLTKNLANFDLHKLQDPQYPKAK